MAKTYTSTIQLNCWKEHTCASCSTSYTYNFVRKIKGTAGTAEKAQINARAAATKALQFQVDLQPCPTCGIFQPDMIAQARVRSHKITIFLTLAAAIVLIILRASDAVQANTVSHWAIGLGVLALIQFATKDLKNINRNPDANRQKAAERIAAGKVKLLTAGESQPSNDWTTLPRSMMQNLAMPILLGSVFLIAAAEILRVVNGWPINDVAYPPVVGPGDSTRIYMPDKITSVAGYWKGTAGATITSASDKSKPPINKAAETNQNSWSGTISVDSNSKEKTSTPWVNVTIPDNADLARTVVNCDISLDIEYPELEGSSTYQDQRSQMSRDVTLRLAAANAGGLYNRTWWGGTIGGFCLITVCGIVLISSAGGLRKQAKPTRILQPAAPKAAPAPPLPPPVA